MDEITLAPAQLARLVEYLEVTVNTPRGLVRLKVRAVDDRVNTRNPEVER